MTFLAYETSVELSQPREGLLIETPVVTYRIATGSRDVSIDGALYRAEVAGRGAARATVAGADGTTDMLVTLPLSHALCQRYMQQGVPPQNVTITLYRVQLEDPHAEVALLWSGEVLSFELGRHVGSFRVPSRLARAVRRRIPTLTSGRGCPHVLFDTNCKVNRAAATVTRTVTGVNGNAVSFSGTPGGSQFLRGGDLYHPASGMRLTINDHTSNIVTLQSPIPGLAYGDSIDLAPGCDHDIVTCRDKYNNVAHYGGAPNLPATPLNPFRPDGFGLYESA